MGPKLRKHQPKVEFEPGPESVAVADELRKEESLRAVARLVNNAVASQEAAW